MQQAERYIGTETEFAIDQAGKRFDEKLAQSTVDMGLETWGAPSHQNEFTALGARFYLDTGDHPEYSTPETFTAQAATWQELIGESFTIAAFDRAYQAAIAQTGPREGYRVRLNKRIHENEAAWGHNGLQFVSWGSHENYQAARSAFEDLYQERVWRSLAAHLVSRVVYTGSGGYIGGRYRISPRSLFHSRQVGNSTTANRPIVNTRDQPLLHDAENWRRLHIITGDANISPWAVHLKLGTTALVVRAMECGVSFDDLCPANPVEAFQAFGCETGLTEAFVCGDGVKRSALAIQSQIRERIARTTALQLNDDEQLVLDEWSQALIQLDRLQCENKISAFLFSIDWFTRLRAIEKKQSRKHPPLKIDALYGQLSDGEGGQGIGQKLRESGLYRLTPDDWSLTAEATAPRAPRAILRGFVAKMIRRHHRGDLGGRSQMEKRLIINGWEKAMDNTGKRLPYPDHPTLAEVNSLQSQIERDYSDVLTNVQDSHRQRPGDDRFGY